MAKSLDPKCKQCRRLGAKLFLKGERCYTPKCSMVKRNYPPGFHGPAGSRRLSEYGLQLQEKQKAKKIYGILEKQFKKYFQKASKEKTATGKALIRLLESRLDNVVFRLGLAWSRSQAKQIINHGHVLVNSRRLNKPSYQVKVGDIIEIKESSRKKKYFKNIVKKRIKEEFPSWLTCDFKKLRGQVKSEPTVDEAEKIIDTRLVIEYYSR